MPDIVSRESAIANGLKRYFTGRSCKSGHAAERYTISTCCVECKKHKYLEQRHSILDSLKCRRSENNAYQVKRKLKRLEQKAGRKRPDTCEVCERLPGKRSLHWDHCHNTGKFRGWLCSNCNTTLGLVGDNPDILRKLTTYLEQQNLI